MLSQAFIGVSKSLHAEKTRQKKEPMKLAMPMLIEQLTDNPKCTVVFRKMDGTIRTMICTLHAESMPMNLPDAQAAVESSITNANSTEHNVIRVWDLVKSGWRSFRYASVKEHSVITEG